jgi:hypothetical protein
MLICKGRIIGIGNDAKTKSVKRFIADITFESAAVNSAREGTVTHLH